MKNNKEDKNKFASVMYGLSEDFGGKISKDSLALRFEALKEYSIEDISKSGTWLLKNREKDFPAVPATREIISAIKMINGKLESGTAAQLECDKVLRNLKRIGVNSPTDFKDPITKYLMNYVWSFHQLGKEKEQDLKWFRKEFVERYHAMDSQPIDTLRISGNQGSIPSDNLKQLLPGKKS